ncbi:Transcriptional regulatory protein OS=Streptomyces cyaneofuscatus OX=66883 GN=G3I52_14225 PE=4 SV=1 [Streptomyces cyaneofuscatus]
MSRQTAQRYLKLLEQTGKVRLTLRYGETGRPEHRYAWA